MNTRSPKSSGWLQGGGLFAALAGLFFATTAFECPGPEPSEAATGGGGAGPSSSSASVTGQGGAGGKMPCNADLQHDPMNCGACGRPCDPIGTLMPSCNLGHCDSACVPGRVNAVQPDAPAPDDGCESMVHRTFITSGPVTADMNATPGGAHAGDDVCNMIAMGAGLQTMGTWRAWLSDAVTSPAQRFTLDFGPYVLLDGSPVAADWMDLTDGSIGHPIDLDEHGMPVGATGIQVWTGTDPTGHLATQLMNPQMQPITECLDWTTAFSDVDYGGVGDASALDGFWTMTPTPSLCFSTNMHLYCSEQ